MPGDASLAKLFREFGQRWEIEQVERGTEWVAVLRNSKPIAGIIGARDLVALRYRMEEAQREMEEAERQEAEERAPG